MSRDVVKVRKVGETLVVTLTQKILSNVDFSEGDSLIMEAIPPRRVIITKERESSPSTHRLEIEISTLEARKHALEQQAAFIVKQHNLNMPVEQGMDDPAIVELSIAQLNRDVANINSEIAVKQLDLFDLQGM